MSLSTDNTDVLWSRVFKQLAWAVLNTLQLLFALFWTAAWACVLMSLRLVGIGTDRVSPWATRCWAPMLLASAGARLTVEGGEGIDWSKPYLLVSNHQSMVDVCVLYLAIPAPLRFVLKAEMRKVPFIGWYARMAGMLFLDRDSLRAGALVRRNAADTLGQGHSLCLFPEGTRSRSGALAHFKSGLLQAAVDARVPVVPIALDGCGKVLPPGGWFRLRPGPIRVRIGAPIPVVDVDGRLLDRQALTHRAHEAVRIMLEPRI